MLNNWLALRSSPLLWRCPIAARILAARPSREFPLPQIVHPTWLSTLVLMPRKIRDLIRDLESAGFANRGGKGSHRNFVHPQVAKPVTIAGNPGDDAQQYQDKAVRRAIEESQS